MYSVELAYHDLFLFWLSRNHLNLRFAESITDRLPSVRGCLPSDLWMRSRGAISPCIGDQVILLLYPAQTTKARRALVLSQALLEAYSNRTVRILVWRSYGTPCDYVHNTSTPTSSLDPRMEVCYLPYHQDIIMSIFHLFINRLERLNTGLQLHCSLQVHHNVVWRYIMFQLVLRYAILMLLSE